MKIKTNAIPVSYTISMDMSHAEAMVLLDILRNVSGDPEGPRSVADEMIAALRLAGVPIVSRGSCGSVKMPSTWEAYEQPCQ